MGMPEMDSHGSETHHAAPRCLLTLHKKAHGTSLDGEGIQAWLEWEMEATRWRVPVEISRSDLEALVGSSEFSPEWGQCVECPLGRTLRTSSKPPETISSGKERACR